MKLASRYFAAFSALAVAIVACVSAIDVTTLYRENIDHVGELQRSEARMTAMRINAYLDVLTSQLSEVSTLPWSSGLLNQRDRQYELERLLKLKPEIYELRFVGVDGRPRNRVSRLARDEFGADADPSMADASPRTRPTEPHYGAVYFREGSTPYVSITVPGSSPAADILVAEVNLRYVTDLVGSMSIGPGGRAFVVDDTNHLIAHPSLSLVHRKANLSDLVQLVQNRFTASRARDAVTLTAQSPETARPVLTSAVRLNAPAWLVFVEQPLDQVMQPVWASVYRAVAFLGVVLLLGVIGSRWLATRLTRPIVELEGGAKRIAAGDLSARVATRRTGDEVQALADEFNRMAENLARSYADLETKVATRTGELADANQKVRAQAAEVAALNEELHLRLQEVAAKKEEAERANAAKTRFLAAASHDLRQPMQAISLLVEVLRERVVDGDVSPLVQKVQASVQGMESLFVSLLDISRLDAGAVHPHTQDFPIQSLLRLIEANFLPQALARNLDLRVMPSQAWVRTDPALLERVLSNLVSNAIRHTLQGRILVGCRRRGDCLQVLVMDTGAGIPAHFHHEIFEEFFQLGNPDRDRTKGLGLGLSIVRRTADLLGHRLIFRSQPGRGSTFGVELPLVRRAAATITRVSTPPDPMRFAGMFIVIIDDDKETRFAIEALCAQWKCHVVAAASVDEAVRQLADHLRSPDLIITDYRLQNGQTGLEAITRICESAQENIPAVIVTGELSVQLPRMSGAPIELLYKPINAEQLWTTADKLLRTSAEAPLVDS